jgi:hypothetical protein
MEEVKSRIHSVELLLASLVRFSNDEVSRQAYIMEKLDKVPNLDIYARFSYDELKIQLTALQEEKRLLMVNATGKNYFLIP